MFFHCQLISSSEALPLRARILRPGQPLEMARYPDDELSTTLHAGVFHDDQIVGVATLVTEIHPHFTGYRNCFRLRGMATETSMHGKGIGRMALEFSFRELRFRGGGFVWCNARQSAFPFYERMGFQYYGELFDIPGIGPHKVMYKEL